MKKYIYTLVTLIAMSFTPAAHAGLIVDTGEGSPTGTLWTLGSGDTVLFPQWLAAEFTLDTSHYITGIEGWLISEDNLGNTFTITVYGDAGETPDTGNLIYSKEATISNTTGANWEGYTIDWGNGLELLAGSYWVSFEVRSHHNQTYGGSMPGGAQNPLSNYAFSDGNWHAYDDLGIGVRITGNVISVPIPAPFTLLGIGLFAIGFARNRQQSAASRG